MGDQYSALNYDPRGVPNTRLRQLLFGLDRLGTGGMLTGQSSQGAGGGAGQVASDLARAAYPKAERLGEFGLDSLEAFGKAVKGFATDDPDAPNPNPSTVPAGAPKAGNVSPTPATVVTPPAAAAPTATNFPTPAVYGDQGHSLGGSEDFPMPKSHGHRPQFYETRTTGKSGENVPLYTNYDPEQGSPDIASGTPQFTTPESEQNALIEKMFNAMAQKKMEDPYGIAAVGARARAEYEGSHPGVSPAEMAPLEKIQADLNMKQTQAAKMEASFDPTGKTPEQVAQFNKLHNQLLQEIQMLQQSLSTSLQMADFRRGGRISSSTPRMLGDSNNY